MKKNIFCLSFALFFSAIAYTQNNLAAGDIAFVSYQSDFDPTNTFTPGVAEFEDRFSIVVLKTGGLSAGTVIYFTNRGWNGPLNTWNIGSLTGMFGMGERAVIKWTVPAGGIIQGKEVFFISIYHDEVPSPNEYYEWKAFSDGPGTIALGTITTQTTIPTDGMGLTFSGDDLIAYQTGPNTVAGPTGLYSDLATTRMITALLGDVVTNVTTYAGWNPSPDASPSLTGISSLPPGLVNGQTAFVMSPGPLPTAITPINGTIEPDNGKFNGCSLSLAGACSPLQMSTIIYTTTNWAYSNSVYAVGTSSNFCTYNVLSPITYNTQPSAVTACTGLPVSFTVSVAGSGTPAYQWQESANASFTTPTTLSNTGVYSGTGTNTLSISDNSALNGKYYRAIVTGTCGAVNSNGALLTVTSPVLSANNTVTQAVGTQNNLYYAASCGVICKIVPSGVAPVSGNLTTQVWVEGAVPTFNTVPFVQRHYQITPAVNAGAATATVTLYFSQAEFTAFNAHPNSTFDLPTGAADATGKANLRVSKYPGSSGNGSGLPGSYAVSPILIDPPDANIIYNATFARWEVTLDVAGFSGFIIQTQPTPIPVKLISFTTQKINNNIQASWQTSSEINNHHFELERSTDGRNFNIAGQVPGNNGNHQVDYSFTDIGAALLNVPVLYYRLKTVSLSGNTEYSKIIPIPLNKRTGFVTGISPNPFRNELNLNLNMPEKGELEINIADVAGRVLIQEHKEVLKGFSTHLIQEVDQLNSGVYLLIVHFKGEKITYKLIK